MRGDVVFYTPKNFLDWCIAKATRGPYCHVAVSLGDETEIAADLDGIRRRFHQDTRGSVFQHLPPGADIEAGIAWLQKQVGLKYGLWDVFDSLLRLLFRLTLYVGRPREYDCSDLVTRYLLECDVDLGELGQEPHLVTPNDLARKFGLT